MELLDWPMVAKPRVEVAVQAMLDAKGFEPIYRAPTHALHLHAYDGIMRIGHEPHPLVSGTLTLSPAHVETSYNLPRAGMHWCIHFQAITCDGRSPALKLPLVQPLGKRAPEAAARFAHIIRLRVMFESAAIADKRAIAAAMSIACQDLLVWAAMIGPPKSGSVGHFQSPVVADLINFMDLNLHRRIRLAELVARAGLSQNYLARLFRKQTGSSMPSYLLGRRIARASLLLTTTDLTVKQIAIRVGLPNAQHFNKQFRRVSGNSPTECRASMARSRSTAIVISN